MAKIKIVSNPYNQEIKYYKWDDSALGYEEINYENYSNSKLLSDDYVRGFFPFFVKAIVDEIVKAYQVGTEKVVIEFEGTEDEYVELEAVAAEEEYIEKVEIMRSDNRLANARDILPEITRIFDYHLRPLILKSVDEKKIDEEMKKFSDVAKDTIPICVLGNYSAGKSTFINSLIGSEVLPSGDEPITAKIYEIRSSDSADRAYVELIYEGEKFKILFKENDNEIIYTGRDKPLYTSVKTKLDALGSEKITVRVNKALEIINNFDKKDEPDAISHLIMIQVPFSGGLWNQTKRNFVIFDTPGSNSASNDKHLEVLKEQMRNLSNGLPVFLSEYDSLDSTDNERLYKVIREVKELDSRFTMIIVNKADTARIPKGGFDREEIDQILGMAVPKNLYSEGIYFVSSIMGLGAKNEADFVDDHCAEIFEGEERKYSDPSSRFYKTLFKNNIMPEQLKRKAVERAEAYAEKRGELLYVNSGLFSVEDEILIFAEKYSHYNKCKQAYLFLDRVIGHTSEEIAKTKEFREQQRKEVTDSFEADKKELIGVLTVQAKVLEESGVKEYPAYMEEPVRRAEVVYSTNQMEEIEHEFIRKQKEEKDFEEHQVDVLRAKVNLQSNFRENVGKFLKEKSVESLKELGSDLMEDLGVVNRHKDKLVDTRHDVDRTASDELLEKIKLDFTSHVTEAQSMLEAESRNYWHDRATNIRNELVSIVTNSSTLSDEKKVELTELILSYEELNLENIAENSFARDDFERGIWIGKIKIVSSDRLNISKLVNKYNAKTIEIVSNIREQICKTHESTMHTWIEVLLNRIIVNVVEFNPELYQKEKKIQEVSDKIDELEKRQIDLTNYTEQIKSMMDWSVV